MSEEAYLRARKLVLAYCRKSWDSDIVVSSAEISKATHIPINLVKRVLADIASDPLTPSPIAKPATRIQGLL